ncbi:MAG: ABC transporter ATP-binding protein [Desulfovibrio sp.]|nr:ABC transporter ATP-binding protein [Desulfovibrio sp.]
MHRLHMLFANLKRIHAVLPPILQHEMWRLFFLMVLLGLFELASIMSLTGFFTVLNSPERVLGSRYAQEAMSAWPWLVQFTEDPRRLVLWACLLPIGMILLKNVFSALVAWRSAMLGERVAAHVGANIMERYLYMPYSWHLSAQSSQALTCMQWRFSLGQMLLNILSAYSNLITVGLLFAGLAVYAPVVTMSTMAFMAAISFAIYGLLRRRIDAASLRSAQAQQQENAASVTALGGVREIIIYQQQPAFLAAITKEVQAGMKPRSFLGISSTVPTWTLESAGFLLIFVTIFLLIYALDAGLTRITATVALLALTAWRVLPSLNRVVGAVVQIRGLQSTALPCLEYYEQLQAVVPERIPEPVEGFRVRKDIVFDHVSYRYPGAAQDALSDISCRIPVGATLGLVGRSGAGKSTFINILSGLLEPTAGRLLVDGKAMNAAELAAYRKQVGYVPQNPYMLAGSVADNVAFSDWGRPLNAQRVKKACREAAIDFLGPECSDIQRAATGLSGGQAQRVSIARAMYVDPGLLIFDEATSALDQASETLVQEAVARNKGKRTCLIAAHRLSTLDVCETLLWLEDGRCRALGEASRVLADYTAVMEGKVEGKES